MEVGADWLVFGGKRRRYVVNGGSPIRLMACCQLSAVAEDTAVSPYECVMCRVGAGGGPELADLEMLS